MRVLRDDKPGRGTVPAPADEIELDAVAVNVGMLVVERRIGSVGGAEDELGFLHRGFDHEVLSSRTERDHRARASRVPPTRLRPPVCLFAEIECERRMVDAEAEGLRRILA